MAPDVGAVWLAPVICCDEPSVVHEFFAQIYDEFGGERCDNDADYIEWTMENALDEGGHKDKRNIRDKRLIYIMSSFKLFTES